MRQVLLSSGQRDTHDRVEQVLRAISPRVSYIGEFGGGMRAKYTAHLLLAGHSLVAAEALAFAGRAGLDIGEVLAALNGTIVSSAVFDQRAHQVLDPSDTPAAGRLRALADALAQLHQFATELDVPTPVLDLAGRWAPRSPLGGPGGRAGVAFYRELTAEPTVRGPARTEQEQS